MNVIIEIILFSVLAPFALTTFDDSVAYRIDWPGSTVSLTVSFIFVWTIIEKTVVVVVIPD